MNPFWILDKFDTLPEPLRFGNFISVLGLCWLIPLFFTTKYATPISVSLMMLLGAYRLLHLKVRGDE